MNNNEIKTATIYFGRTPETVDPNSATCSAGIMFNYFFAYCRPGATIGQLIRDFREAARYVKTLGNDDKVLDDLLPENQNKEKFS
jgi:hypothetical protein